MKKIVTISIVPLTPFLLRYLHIQAIMQAGFEVEYWDLSAIYFPDHAFSGTLAADYVRHIDSLAALRNRLKHEDLRETIFILQVYFEWRVLSLYLLMSRRGCKTVYFPWIPYFSKPLEGKIKEGLKPARAWRACLNLLAMAVKKAGLVKNFDLVFTAGRVTRGAYKDHDRAVNINYLDYDHYQDCRGEVERIVQGDYCVFLDEGCVDNPNVKFLKMQEMDPEKFYGALRRFFDHVERGLKLKVVVAAHPGIQYNRAIFGDREVYEGKTCELVRDARFVISQSSTATSFAVFYKKPLIFVYTDEYASARRVSIGTMKFLAHELGAPSFNIDLARELAPLETPVANTVLYDKYKFTSFTSEETQNKKSNEIIIKSLAEL